MGRATRTDNRRVSTTAAIVCAVGLSVAAGCSAAETSPVVDPTALANSIGTEALVGHLDEFDRIAGEHDGNRALGTAGFDASVDYVAETLRDAGFVVDTPEFETTMFRVDGEELVVDGAPTGVNALGMSPSTGPEGLSARVVRIAPDETPGCDAADYDGLDVTGAVVVVDRGVCTFAIKEQVAADRGAAGLLVVNTEEGPLEGAGLGAESEPRIPVGGVAGADRAKVESATDVTLTLETNTETENTRNVIAQTSTGATDNVVVVGAHLDSVPEGPGINDNASGVAAVLETAVQLGADPNITNAVRFAFWGAEEVGLVGSERYLEALTDEERLDIALYLNFDMLGSPNPGHLVFDGDDSDGVGAGPGPEGSAGIERTLLRYFEDRGIAAEGTDFDGRSDYGPFVARGIPSGGVFSGGDEPKSEEQAAKWGGVAGEAFDPNYHLPEDTVDNIDRTAYTTNAGAAAYATAVYAMSVEGPDGVPVGDRRVAARAEFTE